MQLYKITQDIRQLTNILDEVESEYLLKELDKLEMNFEEKIKNIVMLMRNYESDITAIDEEIKRLQDLKKYKKNQVESLKNYVAYAMETAQKEKLETDIFKIWFRKSKAVEILEEDKIPEDFTEIVEVKKIDKTELKKALQAGQEIEGAQLVQRKNLQIK